MSVVTRESMDGLDDMTQDEVRMGSLGPCASRETRDPFSLRQPPRPARRAQLSCALLVILLHLLALLWMNHAPDPITEAKPELVAVRWLAAPKAQDQPKANRAVTAPASPMPAAKPVIPAEVKVKRHPTQASPMPRPAPKLPTKQTTHAKVPSRAPAKPVANPAPPQSSQASQMATAATTSNPRQQTQSAAITVPNFKAAYLRNPAPAYPPLSRRFREEGQVVLRVQVSPQGQAMVVELHASSGHARLDLAAKNTVTQWRFIPAHQGDTAITAWVQIPIIFQLRS